ncbi:MAG: biopolymer transporter ExbD [Gammaproteobacteria bacterium]|nr:biopolymer transporter ExbD [Gammaproteobacteria bacterium]
MKFRTRRREEISVEITSLIDMVFLLLIFFLVSTTFNRPTQIVLNLPEANGEAMPAQPTAVEIGVTAKGEFFVNRQALVNNLPETLKTAIEKVSGGDRKLPLVISADATAPYQAVVTAMDTAGQAGFANITMATQKPKGGQ